MKRFDVIIVGGSYAGLAAAMALGRALRNVMVIDSAKPANIQTPFAHNFLTMDGVSPAALHARAREQVAFYPTVRFMDGLVTGATKTETGFEISISTSETFQAVKLIFATGIKDLYPGINGFADSWGISVLHCPYCHGYEVRNAKTGVLGNGDSGFEFAKLLSNWTKQLTLFTNGTSTLTFDQKYQLAKHSISAVEVGIASLEHINGYLTHIQLKDGMMFPLIALYAQVPFEQHCRVPFELGCELTEEGYIKTDALFRTTVTGIYACGDNVSRIRTVANAIAMGTTTGMMLNKEMIMDAF
jgi:thioredoxin reductase